MTRLVLLIGILLVSAPALAFHEVDSFDRSANTGGGASYYYTGSPSYKGYDCNICHVDAPHQISIELEGDLRSGSYRAGLIYPITVRLLGEHRGLESAFNPNTFTMDITDGEGAPVGSLRAGAGSIVETVQDGSVAVAEGMGNGEREWELSWWAPDEAVPATIHIAMLDGDGANDPVRRFIDPLNDDVATLTLALCPEEMTCATLPEPEEETSPAGCSAGGADSSAGLLLLFVVFWVCARRRQMR